MLCVCRNGEDARIWKKTVVGCLTVVYVHSLTANAEKHIELQLGQTSNQVVLRTAYLLNANRHGYYMYENSCAFLWMAFRLEQLDM